MSSMVDALAKQGVDRALPWVAFIMYGFWIGYITH